MDGIAGPMTRRGSAGAAVPISGPACSRPAGAAGTWPRSSSCSVGAGFPSGAVDGELGRADRRALRRFQAWAGLGADGLAGPATLAACAGRRPRAR